MITSSKQKSRREVSKTSKERVDKHFDEITMHDLKSKIADAFLDFESKLRVSDYGIHSIGNAECEAVRKKANQMKQEVNKFIDSQVERIICESAIQSHSDFQDSE